MLTLGSALDTILTSHATEAFWLLDLFYNDDTSASNVIHISDKDRTVDGVDYIGIVKSWGSFRHEASLVSFTNSTSTITVTIDNTEHSILNNRFSDLSSTRNFANRKWELFLGSGNTKSTESIGTGIISGDFTVDQGIVTLFLLDNSPTFAADFPSTLIDILSFPTAPNENLGTPLPMTYGIFDRLTSSAGLDFDRMWTDGHFPAPVTASDPNTVGDAATATATADDRTLKMIRTRNLYTFVGNQFWAACAESNVIAPASDGTGNSFQWEGAQWFANIPILNLELVSGTAGISLPNIIDRDLTTSGSIRDAVDGTLYAFSLPAYNSISDFIRLRMKIDKLSVDGGASVIELSAEVTGGLGAQPISYDSTDQTLVLDVQPHVPAENAVVSIFMQKDGGTTAQMNIRDIGFEVELGVAPTYSQVRAVALPPEERGVERKSGNGNYFLRQYNKAQLYKLLAERGNFGGKSAKAVEVVYFAGQGRMYGSWIDTARSNGYDENDVIENPVYIVEDMLRDELGLSSTEIDVVSFDKAGNTTNGTIGDVFNRAVSNILFAFSQDSIENSLDIITAIGQQSGCLYFTSGNGKMKVVARKQSGTYVTADSNVVIDYNGISNVTYTKTPLNDVRNDVDLGYALNYGTGKTAKSVTASDATSAGNTVDGYNKVLTLTVTLDKVLDTSTASAYSGTLLDYHINRDQIIKFTSPGARHQGLEIGDVVRFLNWDTNFTIYGAVPGANDLYMITSITKNGPNSVDLEVQQLSD